VAEEKKQSGVPTGLMAFAPRPFDRGSFNEIRQTYFEAMVGFTQPFFITPCDGRKLR